LDMRSGTVYILKSQKYNKYYIGSTVDIETRLAAHNFGRQGGSFTKKFRPWQIVYIKYYASIHDAKIAEKKIKSFKGGNAFKELILRRGG